jgi:O-antigen/teichoic acid export membrane protein
MRTKYLSDSAILFLSSLFVNAGNYVFNLLIGRWLTPADFAEANLLVSLLLGLSFVATAFQLSAAKYPTRSPNGLGIGCLLMILLMAASAYLKDFFQLSSVLPVWLLAFGIPFYFAFSTQRGRLQSDQSFRRLALTYQVEMCVRLVLGISLVLAGWGIVGISMSLLASLVVTYFVSIPKDNTERLPTSAPHQRFFVVILLYELSQIVINNGDVWLVKHYFAGNEAGLYAALSLIGRVVYFGTWSVVMVLFPKVIDLAKRGLPTHHLFRQSLGIVAAIALLIVLACAAMPDLIVQVLFGEAYLAIAPYLWQYAALTALFALSNVFVYYYLSLNQYGPIFLSIAAGALQLASIMTMHHGFQEVIGCQIVSTSLLLLSLVGYARFHQSVKMQQVPISNIA